MFKQSFKVDDSDSQVELHAEQLPGGLRSTALGRENLTPLAFDSI